MEGKGQGRTTAPPSGYASVYAAEIGLLYFKVIPLIFSGRQVFIWIEQCLLTSLDAFHLNIYLMRYY